MELTYDLYEVENGKEELMLSMTSEHPERIVFGVEDNVLPALCDAIEGKQAGDVFDITLTPEEGFWPSSRRTCDGTCARTFRSGRQV